MNANKDEQVMELWHNMFRMHSYVTDPALKKRADLILRASHARVLAVLPPDFLRCLEPLPRQEEDL